MITTKEVRIKKIEEITSEYIEEELQKMGLDVLRWAITGFDENCYIVNLAVVC